MKTKQRFLLPLLMAIVMMAMSPMKMWADESPTITALSLGQNHLPTIAPGETLICSFEAPTQFLCFQSNQSAETLHFEAYTDEELHGNGALILYIPSDLFSVGGTYNVKLTNVGKESLSDVTLGFIYDEQVIPVSVGTNEVPNYDRSYNVSFSFTPTAADTYTLSVGDNNIRINVKDANGENVGTGYGSVTLENCVANATYTISLDNNNADVVDKTLTITGSGGETPSDPVPSGTLDKTAFKKELAEINNARVEYSDTYTITFANSYSGSDEGTSVGTGIKLYGGEDSNYNYVVAPTTADAVIMAPADCSELFAGLSNLTSVTFDNFNTENVTTMKEMFNGCTNLNYLDLSNFNTAKVTDMTSKFNGCSVLKKIYVSDDFVVTSVAEGKDVNMFSGCSLLVGEKGTVFSKDDIDKSYAHIDGGDGNGGYFSVRNLNATIALTAADFHDDGLMDELCVRRTVYSPEGGYYSMSFSDGISAIISYKRTAEGKEDDASLGYTTGLSYAIRIEPGVVYFVEGYCSDETAPASVTMTTEFTPDQVIPLVFEDDDPGTDGIKVYKSIQISAEGDYKFTSSISDLAIMVSSYIVPESGKVNMGNLYAGAISGGQGSFTCHLQPGTYTIFGQYENNAEADITIQRVKEESSVELPALELGDQTITLPQVTSTDMQYSFTPEKSGDYKFTLSEWDKLTSGCMFNTNAFSMSNIVGMMEDESPTMYADNLEAGKTYYLIIGQGQSDHYTSQLIDKEVTLTVSYTGTKKAVYNSTDHTLTFTHDAVDYTGQGITVMNITNMDKTFDAMLSAPRRKKIYAAPSVSEEAADFPWQAQTDAVAAMKQNVTKAIFDPSFADIVPTTCKDWFSGYANMASIEGFEYLNTEEVTAMDNMFKGCAALQSLTIGESFCMNEVESCTDMFAGTSSLKTLTLKALPYLEEGTFDEKFKGDGVTVKYEIGDVKNTNGSNNPTATVPPTYTRNVSAGTQWGTLTLPFPIKSNGDYQLYELSAASSDALTFSPVESVDANKPCLFKKKNSSATSVTFKSTEVDFELSELNIQALASVNGLSIHGTYYHKYLTSGYFIAQDKFWSVEDETDVYPFRAWFEGTIGSNAKVLNIVVDENGETTSIGEIVNGTLTNGTYYNLNGQRLAAPQKGQINIINGRKVSVK